MHKPSEAKALLDGGATVTQIAKTLGTNHNVTLAYLYRQARDGHLRRSDILFSVPRVRRLIIQEALKKNGNRSSCEEIIAAIKALGKSGQWSSREEMTTDITVVTDFYFVRDNSRATLLGELYSDMCDIELRIAEHVFEQLKHKYGKSETEWWVNGVSERTRQECAVRQEQDGLNYPKEAYLDLIDLANILEKKWPLFEAQITKILKGPSPKRQLISELKTLNNIRNKVMHPLKKAVIKEDEFELVRNVSRYIRAIYPNSRFKWVT